MPALVFPGAVECRLHWTMNGVDAYNVLHGSVAGGFAVTQAIANTVDAAIKARMISSNLQGRCATTTQLVAVALRDLRAANQAEFIGTGAAVVGTAAGFPLPNEVALCVTLRTALAGRSFRGRVYLGGFGVVSSDAAGQIATGLNSVAALFMTGVISDLLASSITMAVLSRPRPAGPGGVPPAYAGALTPIVSAVTRDTLWDSQRRRKR
jgi:hypothetical protein